MSKAVSYTITCPTCNHKQEMDVWLSINVTIDPHLKKELLEGKINMFKCEKCGDKAFIGVSLLYHDMANKFCVQYFPLELLEDVEFFAQFNPDGTLAYNSNDIDESLEYLVKPHIVFDINEMIRYVIFREQILNTQSK